MDGTILAKSPSLILAGHGFSLRLTAAEGRTAGRFVGQATIVVEGDTGRHLLSVNVDFPFADLNRLCDWINDHLEHLGPGLFRGDRRVWVPLDLSLQVELLSGEAEQTHDGSFEGSITLSVFVNVGQRGPSAFTLYEGIQGVVDADDLLRFCSAVGDLG
jgi:hypothetical protein